MEEQESKQEESEEIESEEIESEEIESEEIESEEKEPEKKESRRPDFVLVIKEENLPRIAIYLENLRTLGLRFENEQGLTVPFIFIKVYISEENLVHFSELYDIGNADPAVTGGFYQEPVFFTPFKHSINESTPFGKGDFTGAERIMIVSKVLENAKFGSRDKEFGLTKLTKMKVIETAYPLHDGPLTENGTNMRSLLGRFWSNTAVTHMQQPLDTIYRYFGNEVAFYFAWLEYFNIMLAIPAVLGALTFIVSMIDVLYGNPIEVKEICENNEMLCALCEGRSGCKFKKIHQFCSLAHWSYVFDNNFTAAYAVFISFWATLFMTLWRRKESKLKFRWNCVHDVRATDIRQAYLEKATRRKINKLTGEIEPYTPRLHTFWQYSITTVACASLFGVLLVLVLINMTMKIMFVRWANTTDSAYLRSHAKLMTMTLGSIITVAVMKTFKKLYAPASLRLTIIENPRTQFDFDNSVLYKRYLLAFMNNYVPTLYLAFFKGHFVTLPHNMTFLRKDACQPVSCAVALCIQLSFLMTIRTLMGNVCSLLYAPLKWFCHRCIDTCSTKATKLKRAARRNLPQWEDEYYLEPLMRFSVTKEFSEMVIRYGYVAFFSKAFPLAALCALLNNLVELRLDAYKFVRSHRRPVPVEKSGIGAWNGILRSLSYLSTALNAFVIAFTSDWVAKQVYRQNQENHSMVGYVNSTLSKYATIDNPTYADIRNQTEFCYFRGYHYPPDSPNRYAIRQSYWMNLTFKFVTVFVFEHVIFICNSIFAYWIPYEPRSVQLQLDLIRHMEKVNKVKNCEEELAKRARIDADLAQNIRGLRQ